MTKNRHSKYALLAALVMYFLIAATPAICRDDKVLAPTDRSQGRKLALSDTDQKNLPRTGKKEQTLDEELAALEKQYGVRFFLDETVQISDPVKPLPEGIPLAETLHALLGAYDYFLQYGWNAEDGTNRLRAVWIFPRDTAVEIELVSREELRQAQQCPEETIATPDQPMPEEDDGNAPPPGP